MTDSKRPSDHLQTLISLLNEILNQHSINVAELYALRASRNKHFCPDKAERPSIFAGPLNRPKETKLRNLFRVKASGEVEVPGLVILALTALLAALVTGIYLLFK